MGSDDRATAADAPARIDLANEPPFVLAGAEVRPATLEVVATGRRELLEPRVMQVLVALARRRGQVVSRDQLIELCWSGRVVSEDALTRCLNRLRKLARSFGGFEIETVPRVGHRLAEIATAPSGPSIAVLPFANLSADPDQAYFADGMVVEIVTALSRFTALRVIAASSSLTFRDSGLSRTEIAEQLDVRHLLEGSVRRSEDRVRIAVALFDALDGAQILAERFDGTLEDVFDLQDKVAGAVAARICNAVEAAQVRRAPACRGTAVLPAYDLFLRAKLEYHHYDREAAARARALLSTALEHDPHYAAALSLAALTRANQVYSAWTDDREGDRRVALDLAEQALRFADEDPIVLAYAAGAISMLGGDLAVTGALLEHAVELNPGLASIWEALGWQELRVGNPDKARPHFETALRLDPRSPFRTLYLMGVAFSLMFLREFEEAAAVSREILQVSPGNDGARLCLGVSCAHMGDLTEAARVLAGAGPGEKPDWSHRHEMYRNSADRDLVRSGLRLAGARV